MNRRIAVAVITSLMPVVAGAQGATSTSPSPYPTTMVAVDRYRMDRSAEIALAKSAAPASISDSADVMVLGAAGYETAVKGKNGFVCIVGRAWSRDFGLDDFWSPNTRAPVCFNAAAVRSVLPWYLIRTKWALSGMTEAEMEARTRKSPAAAGVRAPEPGAVGFMQSKEGYINEAVKGPWHPHVMFYAPLTKPLTDPAAWGANFAGSPLHVNDAATANYTTFAVPVTLWSDGTPDK